MQGDSVQYFKRTIVEEGELSLAGNYFGESAVVTDRICRTCKVSELSYDLIISPVFALYCHVYGLRG
jgi:hypothetical protein